MTSLSNSEGLWKLSAMEAFWRDIDRPDITLQQAPEMGFLYPLRLQNTVVKTGDLIDVNYLPPLAYYNSIETIKDLHEVAIYSGVVEEVSAPISTDINDRDTYQEIKFKPKSSITFMDLQDLDQKYIRGESWVDEFTDGKHFLNILRIGDHVSISWDCESYMSDHCILRQQESDFQALYSWGFMGNNDWVRAGNIRPPNSFVERLTHRLLKMGEGLHWSGYDM